MKRPLPVVETLDPIVAAILRRQTPAQRVQTALQMNRLVRDGIRSHLKTVHSDWSADLVEKELARRMLNGAT
jgi:hypothetical protein